MQSQWGMGGRPLGLEEIDGLLVPPGKDYKLLTIFLLVNRSEGLSLPRKCGSNQTIRTYNLLVYLCGFIFNHIFEYHDILM